MNKLHSINVQGNIHDTVAYVNKHGWADYFVFAQNYTGATVVVLRMPAEAVYNLRQRTNYTDPHFDDPVG